MGGVNSEDAQKKIQALFPKRARDTRNRAEEEREVRRTSRCCEADTRFSGECFALFSWPLWRRVSALVFSILVMMQPSVAMASSAVPWATVDGPFVTGNTTTSDGYVVLNVTNEYMAALAIIGRSGEYLQLTSEQLAKLSNASTGGKFYELAHSFQAVGYDGNSSYYPSWWGDGIAGMQAYAMQMVQACGGYGHVWAVETSQAKIASALEDYEVIYNGGSLGGSAPSGTYPAGYYYKIPTNLNNYAPFPANMTFDVKYDYLQEEYVNALLSYAASHNSTVVLVNYNYIIDNTRWMSINAIHGVWRKNYDADYSYSYNEFTANTASGTAYLEANVNGERSLIYYKTGDVTFTSASISSWQRARYYPTYYIANFDPSDWEKVYLDPSGNNWPDTPTNPDPEPQPPTYDTPIPTPPQLPSVNIEIGGNFTADFQGLLDAMDEHCQHLQQAIYDGFADYYDAITEYEGDLYQDYMTWNQDVVDWLQEWFERWDSMFIYEFAMLRNYEKQQVGMLRTLVSTVGDISAKLDTMGRVITAEDIPSSYNADVVATSGSGTLKSAYNALRTKFPFSVLDGIATFAGNLETTPVAPVFDIPVPNPFGNHTPYSIHFDFSAYSDWAAILRTGELVLAYLGLSRSAGRLWLGSGDAA